MEGWCWEKVCRGYEKGKQRGKGESEQPVRRISKGEIKERVGLEERGKVRETGEGKGFR